MAAYYPPVGFHFRVEILGLDTPSDLDMRFSEVGGLSVEMATEDVPAGGENRFIQKFPTRTKFPELVLKRGLLVNSEVFKWVRECVVDSRITPRNVDVTLLNEGHTPLVTWHVIKAFPTKWSVGDLQASTNGIAVETLQFFYQYFTVEKS